MEQLRVSGEAIGRSVTTGHWPGHHAIERTVQTLALGDVSVDRSTRPVVVVRVPSHGPDIVAGLDQRHGHPRADESGGSGHSTDVICEATGAN
jgi:hypothetical protein